MGDRVSGPSGASAEGKVSVLNLFCTLKAMQAIEAVARVVFRMACQLSCPFLEYKRPKSGNSDHNNSYPGCGGFFSLDT
jgi:hypothetical protein